MSNPKIIAIVGPTSSGKSEWAIKIAKKFNGEVVSADSRQVYKGMDIGTGKVTKKEMEGIPHYLLNVASPKKKFTVAQYQKLAAKDADKIHKKGKIPILCGGTGFYVQSVIDGLIIPEVAPDWKLRKRLEKKRADELFELLEKLDPIRARNIDKSNPRRLIRALEIIHKTKGPIPQIKKESKFDVLMIGIKKDPKELKEKIRVRLLKRLKRGMVAEVKRLRKSGLSWKRLEEFGLEYRWVARFLQKKIIYADMVEKIQKENEHYAKRQMTWFKKDKRIQWAKDYKQAEALTKNFILKKKEA